VTAQDLGPASVATEVKAQEVNLLTSKIDSDNTKSATANQAQLIRAIKAHIAAGDKATQRAEDH
jgi:hypothetical protein